MSSKGDPPRKPSLPKPVSYNGVNVTTYDGFGKPWIVVPRAALLWSKLDDGTNTGTVQKGCIIGEQLRITRPNGLRIRLSRTSNEFYDTQWALTSWDNKDVLKEINEHDGIDLESCLIASPFRRIYRDVVDVCYQRIYEDNLETLWEGDRGRLPPRNVVEAKLFRSSTLVLYATDKRSKVVGGAIVHSIRVPSMSLGRENMSTVTYVSSFAARKGRKAGGALWQAVANMPGDLVALHSITSDDTIGFWKHCGMQLLDLTKLEDTRWLNKELFTKSSGLVSSMRGEDLQAALPHSSLPLFVCCLGSGDRVSEDPERAVTLSVDKEESSETAEAEVNDAVSS